MLRFLPAGAETGEKQPYPVLPQSKHVQLGDDICGNSLRLVRSSIQLSLWSSIHHTQITKMYKGSVSLHKDDVSSYKRRDRRGSFHGFKPNIDAPELLTNVVFLLFTDIVQISTCTTSCSPKTRSAQATPSICLHPNVQTKNLVSWIMAQTSRVEVSPVKTQ